MRIKMDDIAGERFGRWTALHRDLDSMMRVRDPKWVCRCDCGAVKSVYKAQLRSGLSSQCRECSYRNKPTGFNLRHDAFSVGGIKADFWAGVLAADGCVRDCGSITLGFKRDDEGFLAQWRDWIGSQHKIYHGQKTIGRRTYESCQLTITSKEICSDLRRHYNIVPRKSTTLTPPNEGRLSTAFACGLWLGDGGVMRTEQHGRRLAKVVWSIYVCGTQSMMNAFSEHFRGYSTAVAKHSKRHLYVVQYRGRFVTLGIAKALMGSMPFRMERKASALEELIAESEKGRLGYRKTTEAG